MRKKLVKPLLMLHGLELKDENGNKINAVGFGISFPYLVDTQTNTIKVRINNVYRRQLEEAFKDEVGDEIGYDE
jgi:hypothetical protein